MSARDAGSARARRSWRDSGSGLVDMLSVHVEFHLGQSDVEDGFDVERERVARGRYAFVGQDCSMRMRAGGGTVLVTSTSRIRIRWRDILEDRVEAGLNPSVTSIELGFAHPLACLKREVHLGMLNSRRR